MNAPITRLFGVIVLLFALLVVFTSRWTVFEAIDLNVSAPVITESVIRRIRSREENNFTDRMLAIMRNEFGGHAVKKTAN